MIPIYIKQRIALWLLIVVSGLLMLGRGNIVTLTAIFIGIASLLFLADDLVGKLRQRPQNIIHLKFTALDGAFVLLFLIEIASTILSPDRLRSQLSGSGIWAVILIYLFSRFYLSDTSLRQWFVHWLTLMGLISALIVITTFCTFYGIVTAAGFSGEELIPLRFLLVPRGMLINDWGSILLAFLPFNIYSLFTLRRHWKIAPALALLVLLIALLLTLSRGTLLSLSIFTLLFFAAVIFWKILSWRIAVVWFGSYLLLSGVILLPLRHTFSAIADTSPHSSQGMSAAGRIDRLSDSWALFKAHPITGIGNGSYAIESMVITNRDGSTYTRRVNNSLMQILLEKGIIGLAAYLLILGFALHSLIQRLRSPDKLVPALFGIGLAVLLFREMTSSTLFEQPTCLLLFAFILRMSVSDQSKAWACRWWGRSLFLGMIVLFSVLAFVTEAEVRLSGEQNRQMLSLMEKGRWDAALQTADKPPVGRNNPILYANKALSLVLRDSLSFSIDNYAAGEPIVPDNSTGQQQALSLFQKASELSPRDPVFIHNQGWIHLLRGDTALGEEHLQQAVELAPFDPIFLVSRGVVAEHSGDSLTAVRYYARAVAASPALLDAPFYKNLSVRRPALARQVLEEARSQVQRTLTDRNNSIDKARLGRISYQIGDRTQTKTLLEEVVRHMPNLNRAWLTLGLVQEDPTQALACFRKAQTLDQSDKLPPYYLARHYESVGDTIAARKYRSLALRNDTYFNYTDYGIRTSRIYLARIWKNEYVPNSLLPWLTTSLPPLPEARLEQILQNPR